MRYSSALAAFAAITPLVNAHGVAQPRIVGLNPRDLKARDLLAGLGARFAKPKEFARVPENQVKPRQAAQCGPGVGSCAAGQCCSPSGYCGVGNDYCYSPGCLYQYGPGCPENQTPTGTNTSTITRTKLGTQPYGGDGIYDCITPGTVAITYDDGPQTLLTAHILDVLASYGAKATFFITGNNINKGQIDLTQEFIADIKRMDAEGHQIASHTWTHLDLSAISQADRKQQMWKNEMALRNIVGKIPTYMRPPYSSCTGQCETDMADLGYHVTYFDVDTDDYEHDSPNLIQKSKDWFKGNITAGGAKAATSSWLEIGHDIHQQTAYNLTDYMLSTLTTLGYKAVTVGECLGDPAANWYRAAGGAVSASSVTGTATRSSSTLASTAARSSSAPTSTATKITTDATCGGTNQYTCLGSTFGNCCSASGWCGSTTDYCGTGCQTGFGNCGGNGVISSSSTKAASSTPAVVSSKASSSVVQATSSTPAVVSSKASSSVVQAASTTVKTSSAAASPSTAAKVSTDGTCGGTSGFTCQGSSFGNCCSQYGWCGSDTDHCGTSCKSAFGTCTSSGAVSSAPVVVASSKAASTTIKTSTKVTIPAAASSSAAAVKKVSTDGTCAGTTGYTCIGSSFGNCCSQYGWCGSTTDHCGTNCNKSFGTCT